MDVSYQFLILARRISGLNGTHMLNKVMLFIWTLEIKKKWKRNYIQSTNILSVCLIITPWVFPVFLQINLTCPSEIEDIQLSPSTKAVKDLHISPCGTLTLLASLGKKLSVLRCAYFHLLYQLINLVHCCGYQLKLVCSLFWPQKNI